MSSLSITIPVIFLGFWLLTMVTSYPSGGFIHLLLAIALAAILLRAAREMGWGMKEKDQRGSTRPPSQTH